MGVAETEHFKLSNKLDVSRIDFFFLCINYFQKIGKSFFIKSHFMFVFGFSGDQELTPLQPQTNKREASNNRTWSATSVVQIPASRERHGAIIKCVAIHESYPAKSIAVEAKLDVKCKAFYLVNNKHIFFLSNWFVAIHTMKNFCVFFFQTHRRSDCLEPLKST